MQQGKENEPKLFVSATHSSTVVSSVAMAGNGSCPTAAVTSTTMALDKQVDEPAVNVTTKQRDVVVAATGNELISNTASSEETTMESESSSSATVRDFSPSRPVQKNKKRCFTCKARLELAFVEIGRCKCGYTYCELHRLPEQHACTYDHKENGRKEAREKMVSPKKHVGTTLKRLDSDS